MEKGGFMRIFKLEFQKIMKNPMLWLLAVIFCLVNCLVIYNEAGNKDTSKELVIMHDIIKKQMIQTTHVKLKIEMKESSYPRHTKNITKKISTCMTNLI